MLSHLLSNWICNRTATGGRSCNASMIIRSAAFTAAAAAFLVWRLFFGQATPADGTVEAEKSVDVDKTLAAECSDSEAASLLGPAPQRQNTSDQNIAVGYTSVGAQGEVLDTGAKQCSESVSTSSQPLASLGADSGKHEDRSSSPHAQAGISSNNSSSNVTHSTDKGTYGEEVLASQLGLFSTEDADLVDVNPYFPAESSAGASSTPASSRASAQAALPHSIPEHPTYRAQTHRWQSWAAAEGPPSASSAATSLHASDGADHFAVDDESPKLRLHVLTGPAAGTSYISAEARSVKIGRMAHCELSINDQEVSSKHAVVSFSSTEQCWHLADLGSLNGTILNSRVISREGRQRSDRFALVDRDILQLGTNTQIRVRCHPSPLRPNTTDAGALHTTARNLSPRQQAAAAASPTTVSYPPLRLSAATITRTGLLHVRHGSSCEDVATWRVPFLQASTASQPPSRNDCSTAGHSLQSSGIVPSSSDSAAMSPATSPMQRPTGLFCVFDGHGGGSCSAQARTVVPAAIAAEFSQLDPLLEAGGNLGAVKREECWERAYLSADAILSCDEGCTCTTVLAERHQDGAVLVQAANVGDSSAVLVRIPHNAHQFPHHGPPDVVRLTLDHKVVEPSEQARLRARGFQGKTRLYGLALSRSLGDKFLKEQDVGLLACPHISPVTRISSDEEAVVIIASDGLWDVVTPEAAGAAAVRLITGTNGSAAAVAEGLMWMALQGRSQDDITVMIVHLHPGDRH